MLQVLLVIYAAVAVDDVIDAAVAVDVIIGAAVATEDSYWSIYCSCQEDVIIVPAVAFD